MEIITKTEVARHLHLSTQSVDRLVKTGALIKVSVSPRRVGILTSSFNAYLISIGAGAAV